MGYRTWATVHGLPHIGYHTWATTHGLPYMGYRTWATTHGLPYMGYRNCQFPRLGIVAAIFLFSFVKLYLSAMMNNLTLLFFPRDDVYENIDNSIPKRTVSFEKAMGRKPVIDLSSVKLTPIEAQPQIPSKKLEPTSPPCIPRRKDWWVLTA